MPLKCTEYWMAKARRAARAAERKADVTAQDTVQLEAAIEFQKSGRKRDPIPEDVKLIVWARDGGACTRCGSKQDLHFDHIIPFAKGGGNSEANIQILCSAARWLTALQRAAGSSSA
jgi:hypothetical protein